MIIAFAVYLIAGMLLTTLVERKPSDPLGLFVGFFFVVFLWPYIVWRSIVLRKGKLNDEGQ